MIDGPSVSANETYPRRVQLIVAASIGGPWGPIHLAATTRGVAALEQQVTAEAFADRLARRFGAQPLTFDEAIRPGGARALAAVAHARAALGKVEAFLDGDPGALEGLAVDLDDRPAWDRLVLEAVRGIHPGATASYGEIARRIGRAGAARAVGGAVGRNPIGLVIPCHRVIAGDGTLGGYGGGWWGGRAAGLELKRTLLAREGVRVDGRRATA